MENMKITGNLEVCGQILGRECVVNNKQVATQEWTTDTALNGISFDQNVNNEQDTWIPVYNVNKIQHVEKTSNLSSNSGKLLTSGGAYSKLHVEHLWTGTLKNQQGVTIPTGYKLLMFRCCIDGIIWTNGTFLIPWTSGTHDLFITAHRPATNASLWLNVRYNATTGEVFVQNAGYNSTTVTNDNFSLKDIIGVKLS